jgi:pimeloyl-ACP methyl ester carboxylesterase
MRVHFGMHAFTCAVLSALLPAAALAAADKPAAPRPAATATATVARTYVLVHGAWGGGWDWRGVDDALRAAGHHVQRVTLTGLGERVHLATPEVNLTTHVTDVVNTLAFEQLRDVILVGHSYGGMVITGAADRASDRVRRLVYVDALLPEDGESVNTLPGRDLAWVKDITRNGLMTPPWVVPGSAPPSDVPHPAACFEEPLALKNEAAKKIPGTYILTLDPGAREDPTFSRHAERAKKRGFTVHVMEADHNPQRTAREALMKLLLAAE